MSISLKIVNIDFMIISYDSNKYISSIPNTNSKGKSALKIVMTHHTAYISADNPFQTNE